ncbi:MAG TPA: hypothetical protein VGE77_09875 [Nocardioides sp.]
MSRHRRNARGRGARRAAFVVGVVALVLSLVSAAWAVFTDTATVTAGPTASAAFTSGTLNPPGTPTAAQTSATSPLTVTWTAASVTGGGGGVAPSGYEVFRYSAAVDGTATSVCTTTTALSCTTTAPATGSGFYGVRAKLGSTWIRDSGRLTWMDALGPTVTFTRPTAGLSLAAGLLARAVTTDCGAGFLACGTASDSSTLASAQYRFVRNSNQCWNGSAWVGIGTVACANNAYQAGTLTVGNPATTSTWRVPGTASTAYTLLTGYVLSVRVTDVAGRVTESSISFSTVL